MFKVGVFMGWADLANGPIPWATLVPVYVGACLWTVTYETIYQHQVKSHPAPPAHPTLILPGEERIKSMTPKSDYIPLPY